ncbi:hypothetical protein ES703_09442 [subsurface metagenome]
MLPLNAIEREMVAIYEDCMRENGKEEQRQGKKQGPARGRISTLVIPLPHSRGFCIRASSITHSLN